MNVLHYVDENKLSWGEAWIQLLKQLARLGVENHVVCRNGGVLLSRLREEGISAAGYKPAAQWLPQIAYGFGRILDTLKPDLIHTRLSSAATVGGWWGKKKGIPVLETIDKFPKRHYHENASLLLPCSNAVAEHMYSLGFSREMTEVVPNAIEVDRYRRDESVRQQMRAEHGISDGQTVVVGAGRLVDWKGFADLIRGFALSDVPNKNGKLWIVGSGPEKENLQRLAQDLNLNGSVEFTPFVQDIRPYLWASDVFVQPSCGSEAFGIVLIEAMAASLSCIATLNGGMKDIIADGVSGLHVPIRDAAAIASALNENMNPAFRSQLSQNALNCVRRYDVESVALQTYSIYEKYARRRSVCSIEDIRTDKEALH